MVKPSCFFSRLVYSRFILFPILHMSSATPSSVRFEWFQTPTTVTFVFFVKDRREEHVEVEVEERSLHLTLNLEGLPGVPAGQSYQYSASPLFGLLDTTVPVKTVVKPMKIEVMVTKKVSFHWPTLEVAASEAAETKEIKIPASGSTAREEGVKVVPIPAPALKTQLAYPSSKKKDWSNFDIDDEEEKPDGEAALQKLFQQIYGNGTDEQRKAMIKSFTESSGTVLSTNWEDVGNRKVTVEPPTGMEAKKLD